MNKKNNLLYYISIIFLCIILSQERILAKETDYMNFKKMDFYYNKETMEYILVVRSVDPSTSRLSFDRDNIHIQYENKNNISLTKPICRNDLTVINLGDFRYKGAEEHTLFRFNMLVDNSASIDDQTLEYIELALTKFIQQIPLAFDAQIVKLSSNIQSKTGFVKDKNLLNDYIKQRHQRVQSSALHDSIAMAIKDLKSNKVKVYFKFIIVITNSIDTFTQKQLDSAIFKSFFETDCFNNNIQLFVVGLSDKINQTFLKSITDKNGLYIHVNNLSSSQAIEKAFDKIANIISDTYIFKFPAIGSNYEDLKTIYLLKKNSVSDYTIIQDFIIENNNRRHSKPKSIGIGVQHNDAIKEKNSYSLNIKTIPENAIIEIKNFKKKYYDGIKLIPGNYEILISKDGYKKRKYIISIIDEDYDKTIKLEKEQYKPTKFQFPRKINYKVYKNNNYIGNSKLYFETIESINYLISWHIFYGANKNNNIKFYTYIRISDLFLISSTSYEGRKKLHEFEITAERSSIFNEYISIHNVNSTEQNKNYRTEIAFSYHISDLLSLFVLLSKSVNDKKQLCSEIINLFVFNTSYIVSCNCLDISPYEFKGNTIKTEKFVITYEFEKNRDLDLVTLYIYKNLKGYTFPVCFEIFEGLIGKGSFKFKATDLLNE